MVSLGKLSVKLLRKLAVDLEMNKKGDRKSLLTRIKKKMKRIPPRSVRSILKSLQEDGAPVNATGSAVAGTTGEPPVGKHKKKPVIVRRFAGNDVFVVDPEKYHKAYVGKKKYARYEEYVGNDEIGEAIRQYGRDPKNRGKAIVLQNSNTGAMVFLRYGGKYE